MLDEESGLLKPKTKISIQKNNKHAHIDAQKDAIKIINAMTHKEVQLETILPTYLRPRSMK